MGKRFMKDKKVYSVLIIATLIFGLAITAAPTMAGDFNSVYGFLYINGEIAPSGITVKLTFSENPEEITVDTDSNGYFDLGFTGHNWEEGYFKVKYDGKWYTPEGNPSVEIIPEEIGYEIDLHIEIGNNPPNAPYNPNPSNGAINVDNNKVLSWLCSDPDGDPLTFDVYFGDSTSPPKVFTGQSGKSYNPPGAMDYSGTYYWRIVAHDDKGASTSGPEWSFTVEASEPPPPSPPPPSPPPSPPTNANPVAVALVEEPLGFVGQEITFDGSNSSDSDGTITNYTWDFGDNTTGYGVNPTHAYDTPGEYTVILTVTDDDGATDTDETAVNILVPNIPPELPEVDGPQNGTINTTYEFTALSTDDDNDTIQYIFDWGDGQTNETDFVPNGTQVTLTHTWSVAGNYTIRVTAYDNETLSEIAEYLVSIEEEKEPTPEEEYDYTWLILLLILIIILLIIFLLLIKRKKPEEKKQPPKKSSKKSGNKNKK